LRRQPQAKACVINTRLRLAQKSSTGAKINETFDLLHRFRCSSGGLGDGPGGAGATGPTQAAGHLRQGQHRERNQPAAESESLDHACAVERLFQQPLPGSPGNPAISGLALQVHWDIFPSLLELTSNCNPVPETT
jgi:hypothetical protein